MTVPFAYTPVRKPDGICSVCGNGPDLHSWKCISYFMNEVGKSYAAKIPTVERLLLDIVEDRSVTKLRASMVLEELRSIKNTIRELGK